MHWEATKHILKYVKGILDIGLDPNDHRFTINSCVFLGPNLVSCVIAHVMVELHWICTLHDDLFAPSTTLTTFTNSIHLQWTNNKYTYKSPTNKLVSMTVPTFRPRHVKGERIGI